MENYIGTLLAVGGIFLFFVLAILIALYVIESFALYTLAKNNGQQDKAILAWIPFVNQGFYGFLAGDQNIFGTNVQGIILGVLMIIFPIVTARVSGFLFYIVALCGITVAYFTLNGLYKKMNRSGDPTVVAVVCAIIPLVRIIYVFIHRNDIFEEEAVVVE
ncbi:MAG: hypothetical protein HXM92_03715 [Oribacterium parvum]|jgi:hypothetical protein|uniref:hypothetical protein n=1 Tax=Oribacterium parvum TaxID=1501329 RepID=UPI001CB1089E|nr:hypothetical protein [Oribacterium parvum]MBF1268600.1 hypothetical protein [Oribacterium parvum]